MADTYSADERAITEQRTRIGLEATWEIDALNDNLRALCEGLGSVEVDTADLSRLGLQIRGLTARIEQLNNIAMSVLGDDETPESLAFR